MELTKKRDKIISRTHNEEYAFVEIEKDEKIPYFYKAKLLTNSFPEELVYYSKEWTECVNDFVLSLLDEIEDKIKEYDLYLVKNQAKIFRLEIEDSYVTFFIKYPTIEGFIDDYPE